MKKNILLLVCVMSALLSQAQNAIVRGTVRDSITKEVLTGAQIYVEESSSGTITDVEGRYKLVLSAGTYNLKFTYLGFKEKQVSVEIKAGETQALDVEMVSGFQQLGNVVITGNLQGQAKALNQQKSADNIQNVVAADQIGRFPDPNAAEALQRISGVNIERDQGEGRYVLVRGLAPQFTNISINGEQIPSPEADVRFVALDVMPSDQLSSMIVTKALTPDMDGDAIGGSVNLITRTAESSKAVFRGSILGGYNGLMGRGNVQGSAMYGQRFLKDKLGVLLNASYYQNNLGSDNWEREPFDNEFELRDYELVRTRTAFSASFDYRIDKNNELYLRGLYSRFTDREWRRRYIFIPDDEEIERSTKDRFESQGVATVNLGGKHSYPNLLLDYEAQFAYANQNTPFDNEVTFIAGLPSSVNFNSREFPSLDAPGYLENGNYEYDQLEMSNTLAEDRNLTAKFNVEIPYRTKTNPGSIKFGAKARMKEKRFSITQNKYEGLGEVPNLTSFEGGLLDQNFLGGKYALGLAPNMSSMIRYFNANPSQFELQVEDKAVDEALEAFEATEQVYAAYAMAKQDIRNLRIVGGVRYEYTSVNYKSKDVLFAPNGDLESIIPVEGGTNYDYILPQLHFKYALSQTTNLRAAITYSYARPNFSEIIPAQEANIEDQEARVGNPALNPVSALNLDLMGERYFKGVGVVSAGVFYKQLDDFIYQRTLLDAQYPLNTPTPLYTGVDVTQTQNGESAIIMGAELSFQRQLNFLPGIWKNFNVYTNYTYSYSEAQIQNRLLQQNEDGFESLRLPGQASHMGNAALAFENKKFSIRLALNFNGEYLSEIGSVEAEDIYIANRSQLDFSASYSINQHFRVFTELLNLTNQPFEAYQGTKDTVIQREFYGSWGRMGVKFNF